MLRRSIYGSLVQALYMIALIHFHNLLATVESVSGPVYPFGGNIGGQECGRTSRSGGSGGVIGDRLQFSGSVPGGTSQLYVVCDAS